MKDLVSIPPYPDNIINRDRKDRDSNILRMVGGGEVQVLEAEYKGENVLVEQEVESISQIPNHQLQPATPSSAFSSLQNSSLLLPVGLQPPQHPTSSVPSMSEASSLDDDSSTRTTRSGRRFSGTNNSRARSSRTNSTSSISSPNSQPRKRGRPRSKSITTTTAAEEEEEASRSNHRIHIMRNQPRNPKTGAFISLKSSLRRQKFSTCSKPTANKRCKKKKEEEESEEEKGEITGTSPFKIPFITASSSSSKSSFRLRVKDDNEGAMLTRRNKKMRKKRTREQAQSLRNDPEWQEWLRIIRTGSPPSGSEISTAATTTEESRYRDIEQMGGRGALAKWGWWKEEDSTEREEDMEVTHQTGGVETMKVTELNQKQRDNEQGDVLSELSQSLQLSFTTRPTAASTLNRSNTSTLPEAAEEFDLTKETAPVSKPTSGKRKRRRGPPPNPKMGSRSSTRLALKQSTIEEDQSEKEEQDEAEEEEIDQSKENKKRRCSIIANDCTPFDKLDKSDSSILKKTEEQDETISTVSTTVIQARMGPNRTVDEQEALSALLSLYGSVGDEDSSENIIGRNENAVGRTKRSQPADEEQIQGEEKEELEGRGSASASGGNGFEIKDGSGGDVSTCETKEEEDDLQQELIDPSQNSASYLPPSPVSPSPLFRLVLDLRSLLSPLAHSSTLSRRRSLVLSLEQP